MNAPKLLTKAEQKLEYLKGLHRPLTDQESDELRRAMHAVYEHERRLGLLQMHRDEELLLLDKIRAEAAQPDYYASERR
jgi:hypothetical protein